MGHRHRRRIPQQRIRPRHVQSPRRNLHPRPRNDSVVDRLLHVRIGITRALGLQVANGSESIVQRPPRIHRRQNRPVLRRLLQQLLVIIRRRDVPLQQNVRMRVDQSRQTRLAR